MPGTNNGINYILNGNKFFKYDTFTTYHIALFQFFSQPSLAIDYELPATSKLIHR